MADQIAERNLQTYGVPIYAADCVPQATARSNFGKRNQENSEDGEPSSRRSYIVFSGGGGQGNNGIPNVILICKVDLETNSLSEQPSGRLVVSTDDLPYRMAVHPGGDGLVCAFQDSCRRFDWESIMSPREDNEAGDDSEGVIKELKDVGQQLALAFNREGSVFAAGGDDGTLNVFEWPAMKSLLNESQAHESVKSLSFSESGKFLASLGSPLCRVWEVNASAAVASLSKEKDEIFASCRFSVDSAGNEVLYIAANTERGGSIITWDTTSWRRKRSTPIKKNSITAFNVSDDGKLLAVGTLEGDVMIIESTRMRINQVVKKAHLGLVTALTFSPDSRCLVSVSFDSRARLTVIKEKGETHGTKLLVVALLSLLMYVIFVLYIRSEGGIIKAHE